MTNKNNYPFQFPMPHSHLTNLTDDLLTRATQIRLVCFDVDGTLTDGRLYFDSEGHESKAFDVRDGLGIMLLRKAGINVAFITARAGNVAQQRGRDLGVEVHISKDKLGKLRELCAALNIDAQQVAFMGDDIVDLPPMREAGLAVVPADAHPWVVPSAHWKTQSKGGQGAARELCDLLLSVQGHAAALREQGL
jgi:3-deoxy-D-manno-octulosonate 8-phosphate phosphatase (KDO 8-P phosphatase)